MTHYIGGKARIGKIIYESFASELRDTYVEPFVGMGGVLRHAMKTESLPKVHISDYDKELIDIWIALVFDEWEPPSIVTKDEFNQLRSDLSLGHPALRAFVKYGCAFSGLKWSCWADISERSARSLMKVANTLREAKEDKGVEFVMEAGDYRDIPVVEDALHYCDPPYEGTRGYKGCSSFDHDVFWRWASELSSTCNVFVSEASEPHSGHWEEILSFKPPLAGYGGKNRHYSQERTEYVWKNSPANGAGAAASAVVARLVE